MGTIGVGCSTGNARATGGSRAGNARRTGGGVTCAIASHPKPTPSTIVSARVGRSFLLRCRESHIGDAGLRTDIKHVDDVSVSAGLVAAYNNGLFGVQLHKAFQQIG